MQAILLAAGKSSRFYPFGEIAHKSLISVMGKPLIVHTIENLAKSGITKVIVVIDKTRKVEDVVALYELPKNIDIIYVEQAEALGMGNALLSAVDVLDDRFFLLNAYHVDFELFAKPLLERTQGTVLTAHKVEKTEGFGFLEVRGDRVVSVIEKPEPGQAPSDLKVVGIYMLEKKICKYIEKEEVHDHQFEYGLSAYAKDHPVQFVIATQKGLSLKYPWDLLKIKDYLFDSVEARIAPSAKVAQSAVIRGNVYISDDAEIMDGAVINGPCFIGRGAYVGTNSILRNGTVIENNVVVGAGMEVKNSLIMDKTKVHGGFIGDSVVGVACKVGHFFCTANVRLDRDTIHATVKNKKIDTGNKSFGTIIGNGVVLGARVTTMPGVIIGNNSRVGPNTNVSENIPSDTYYYAKFESIMEKPNKS